VNYKGKAQEVDYWWCLNHNDNNGMWVRHNPAACEQAAKKKGDTKVGFTTKTKEKMDDGDESE
jgi:hypothetical protein